MKNVFLFVFLFFLTMIINLIISPFIMITMLFTDKILLAWYNSFMTATSCFLKYFYDVKIYM